MTENQLNNLRKLSKDDIKIILDECIEILGCVTVQEYSEVCNMPKRTVYDKIKKGKIDYIKISDVILPFIN